MDALDKKKAFLLRGDDLARMQRLLAEWETLTVHLTDAKTPSLTRGTLATRLEIPKAMAIDADHPFKVIDASDGTGPKVRVLPGTVYVSIAPTVGGVSILAEPPPTISTAQSGFLVMRSTWPDDFVPRCVPLSVVIEFEPGDPSASYSPPNADTRTSARMVFGRVWVADGKITKLFSELSRNVVMERQIYDNGDTSVKHIAFGR